ncbi:hypothetical protein VTK56DRAFT_10282 [Thermocarpiscus australiensis]
MAPQHGFSVRWSIGQSMATPSLVRNGLSNSPPRIRILPMIEKGSSTETAINNHWQDSRHLLEKSSPSHSFVLRKIDRAWSLERTRDLDGLLVHSTVVYHSTCGGALIGMHNQWRSRTSTSPGNGAGWRLQGSGTPGLIVRLLSQQLIQQAL